MQPLELVFSLSLITIYLGLSAIGASDAAASGKPRVGPFYDCKDPAMPSGYCLLPFKAEDTIVTIIHSILKDPNNNRTGFACENGNSAQCCNTNKIFKPDRLSSMATLASIKTACSDKVTYQPK
ncbi:hypothetical protein MJO29_003992 [Puccinia striiformis f. sp. tritici]|uniref:Hydrophobin n=2 Tax=Puccinia striiformis TaxID=27350 RepID=A0A2S4VPA2_9BASI|nr:hypothetical protein Pst134EA_007108 [Puccinia striiformis f. sp. tritici]KAH9469831.1 hypothetical protein Pst134EA_007108 [Puccinia striiformis f. sp. tritici]KAI7963565.1 hypothetical protein MJO29_003992 [Puccinia striiformis f. sp. tritici]POW06913.1 hypothetical protein PSTT_08601 [Puccinia striiformis]POW11309.1 hypothetical protein PSHT_08517 [Puccinia striiformis]